MTNVINYGHVNIIERMTGDAEIFTRKTVHAGRQEEAAQCFWKKSPQIRGLDEYIEIGLCKII